MYYESSKRLWVQQMAVRDTAKNAGNDNRNRVGCYDLRGNEHGWLSWNGSANECVKELLR
jgi:hypothetical protein